MVSTDGRTDRRTDTEGYNIIPRHTLVAGYNNILKISLHYVTQERVEEIKIVISVFSDLLSDIISV